MSASGRARAEDLGQVLVDRVAGDAEQPGDRGNGVLGPGEEVAGVTDLLGGHGRWPAEAGTAGACGVEAFASTRPRPGLGSAGRGSGPLWTPARTRSGRRSERLVRARAGQLRPGVRPPVDGTEKGHPKFMDTRTGLRGTVSRTWSRWRQPGIRPVVDHVHVTPGCSASPATRSTSTCPRSPPPELYPTPTYPPRRRQPHELIAHSGNGTGPWSALGLFLPMVLTGPYHARWVVWRN